MKKHGIFYLFVALFALLLCCLSFSGRLQYALALSIGAAVVFCLLFFITFEQKKPGLQDLMPIVVVCTIASVGRIAFSFVPQVQPVTVLVILTGVAFGARSGFVTGALTALISNMVLSQGPWTPWQMLAWGMVGLISGGLAKIKWCRSLWVMSAWSFLAAFLYSLITDIWTVASLGAAVNAPMVWTIFGAGLAFNVGHAVGNVALMLVLFLPVTKAFERIQTKYGVLLNRE